MVICIKNLRVSGILGVYPEERNKERDIVINARVEYNAQAAILSDALDDALNYKEIRDRIQKVVAETKFNLLEKLADQLVRELTVDSRILKLELEIDKPGALRLTDSVSAIIHWERTT
jgi:D-erythro-7,8-dihydroneopterin triphosphate epimerase